MKLDWKSLNTEDRIAVIRVGAAKKMSARQIADEMENCTRNAIIGASHRYGIKLEGKTGVRASSEKPSPPKTGVKTRPLAPLKYLKAKKPKGTKTAPVVAQGNVDVPPDGSDWTALSAAEKASYVIAHAALGMSSTEIAASLLNATKSAVKSFASKHKIHLPGNASSSRSSRSAERTGGIQRIKPKPLTWAEMSVEQKVSAIQKHIKDGRNAGDIADIYSISEKAVLSCCERQKIKIKRRPKNSVVNIMDIGSGQCRAPKWEDRPKRPLRSPEDWMFCGKLTIAGSSYCRECHDRFWVKPDRPQRYDRRFMAVGYGK